MKKLSKIGIGLYLGEESEIVDNNLLKVLEKAVNSGINVFDCSPSYRNGRSEKLIGKIVEKYPHKDYNISTKGGFVPFDFSKGEKEENDYIKKLINKNLINKELFDQQYFQTFDIRFLEHSLKKTLKAINRNAVEIYYIHNPEYLLEKCGRIEFLKQMRIVFYWIKKEIDNERIIEFGISSWLGFFAEDPSNRLQIEDFINLSKEVGIREYLRYIQIPYNFYHTELLFFKGQKLNGKFKSLGSVSEEYKLSLITSATLNQGKLVDYEYPQKVKKIFPKMTSAQTSLAFVLSTPSIESCLIGTNSIDHLEELLMVETNSLYNSNSFFRIITNK